MSTTTNAPCVIDNGLERDTKIGLIVGAVITGAMALILLVSIVKRKIREYRELSYKDEYKYKNCKNCCKFVICNADDTRIFVDDPNRDERFISFKKSIDTIFNRIIEGIDLSQYSLRIIEFRQLDRRTHKSCGICNNDFSASQTLIELPCGHVYHKRCLIDWFREGGNYCPTCRETIIQNNQRLTITEPPELN